MSESPRDPSFDDRRPSAGDRSDPLDALREMLQSQPSASPPAQSANGTTPNGTTPNGASDPSPAPTPPPPPPQRRSRRSPITFDLSQLPLQSESFSPRDLPSQTAPPQPSASDRPPRSRPARPRPDLETAALQAALQDLQQQMRSLEHRTSDPAATTRALEQSFEESLRALQQQVRDLDDRLGQATQSMGPLMPVVEQILHSLSPAELRNEVIQSLVPAIDRVIRERAEQNSRAMHLAFADILPGAIAEEIERNPRQIANALGPEMAAAIHRQIQLDRDAIRDALASEMGRFIKAQIELERDAMVDALYPVIGNTIAKYMGEAIREINAKVENTLSVEGIQRKIRARIQGVSEAELILRDAIPFKVKAAFLIHKSSGLVICDAQITDADDRLESDTIAGMLTAIRSFANDCMVKPEQTSELNEIEYDTFKLVMEVAGYCYLAVVAEGEVPRSFVKNLRETLAYIVQKCGDAIEQYDGDPDSVPPLASQRVQMLVEAANFRPDADGRRRPPLLLGLLLLLLLGAGVWGGWRFWQQRQVARARAALRSQPELAVYRLEAAMEGRTLVLLGDVPTESLRSRAEAAVSEELPARPTDNRILAVDVPPPPELVRAEVDRVATALNALDGVQLQAQFGGDRVSVWGELPDSTTANRVSQAFERIPGVTTVVNTARVPDSPLEKRVYFASGSTDIRGDDAQKTVEELAAFLQESPPLQLEIIGHTDEIGTDELNRTLARRRAQAVRAALIARGVDGDRLTARGSIQPPPDLDAAAAPELRRCARWTVRSSEPDGSDPAE